MKTIDVLRVLLTIVVLLIVATGHAAAADGASVTLRWALGAIQTESTEPAAIKKDAQLETGAKLKFLVEPLSPGSVYLLLLDSDDNLHVLYSGSSDRAEGSDPAYVPPGSQWFELDDAAGREHVHVGTPDSWSPCWPVSSHPRPPRARRCPMRS